MTDASDPAGASLSHTGGLGEVPSRMASVLVGGGALLFIVADNVNGVARDVYAAEDAAEVQALIEASEGTWDAWFALGGAALLVTALGLWLTGREIVRGLRPGRTGRATTVLPWAGAATGANAVLYLWSVVASPERLGEFYGGQFITPLSLIAGLTGLLGLAGVLVGMGLTLRRLGHLRWLAWVLLVLGPLSLLTSAFAGPEASYLLLLVLAAALAIRPLALGPHARPR